jgi:fucokinase
MTTGNDTTAHTLQVALDANAAAYKRAVQTSVPGDCWDFVVLTATNEKQASGYRQELALRHRSVGPTGAFFPALQRSLVVADPPGPRIGSGGATLGVMRALAEQFNISPADWQRLRILLIHSGGMSQRLPAYSPLGKIFAPLPLLRPDGQIATLFDHLYLTLAGLPERLSPGMLVLAGDVFLLFDHRHVSPPPSGVTALTMRVDADMGRGHGVFVIDDSQRIIHTLQKVSVQTMQDAGATDSDGRVLIDTGLLFFDADRTKLLADLAGVPEPRLAAGPKGRASPSSRKSPAAKPLGSVSVDLYEDMTAALAAGTKRDEFLKNPATRTVRQSLWKPLHGVPFQVMQLDGQFLHLGTTRQFRDAMVGHNPSPAAELFQQNVLAHSDWRLEAGRRVYHSVLLADRGQLGILGAGSVVEHSILRAPSRVGAGSVVSQVFADSTPIDLDDNLLLFQVPVRESSAHGSSFPSSGTPGEGKGGGSRRLRSQISNLKASGPQPSPGVPEEGAKRPLQFVHVLCGVDDDFKGSFDDGRCLFMNQPIDGWMKRNGIKPDEIWKRGDADKRTLWTARLFVATPDRDAAAKAIRVFHPQSAASKSDIAAWRKSTRYSMAMLLAMADPAALIEHREVVSAYLQTGELLGYIQRRQDVPVESLLGHWRTPAAYAAAERRLRSFASADNQASTDANVAIDQARALWCSAQLLQRPDHPDPAEARPRIEPLMAASFAKVAQASEIGHHALSSATTPTSEGVLARRPGPSRSTAQTRREVGLPPNTEITATAPVRLDLSGGWSDTPPYCFERGGHVVNVAIDLESRPPVRAVVRTLKEPKLILESTDLGRQIEVDSTPAAGSVDVRDPFALHKIALAMTGLLPADGNVARHLKKLGAGIHLLTECRVPKGSGLGTSSILAAAVLAALHDLRGHTASTNELIEGTLLLEQRLSTGGGWQDQVGGIVGGVKSTITAPGIPQRPVVEQLPLSDAAYQALQERLVVYFSGQQRLARDILRRVMGRWLGREPAVIQLTDQLKRSAAALRVALLKGQWPAVAREIGRYWQIKKELYPGSTTPTIDVLFLELRDLYLASGLAGAGGGGFAYFFCKDRKQAERLREALAERSGRPGSLGTVYDTQINRSGLVVTRD